MKYTLVLRKYYSKNKEILAGSKIKIFRCNKSKEKNPDENQSKSVKPIRENEMKIQMISENLKQAKSVKPIRENEMKIQMISENLNQAKSVKPIRENEMKIQMISENLYKQVFRNCKRNETNIKNIEKWTSELQKHGITLENSPKFPEVELKLPTFKGNDILEHFYNIAKEQIGPYENLIDLILKSEIPKKPKSWKFQAGWTKYDPESNESITVPYPEEEILIFDIETCVSYGKTPIMATAVGPKFWYSWVSQDLINSNNTKDKISINELIPLESKEEDLGYDIDKKRKIPKLIVGHNVSFDRARIKEQYWIENTNTRFLDTMSMHVSVSGVTSYQRALLKSHKEMNEEDLEWSNQTSLNSLVEVYKLYCQNELSKERRNVFVEGNLQEIKDDFYNLMDYCADDVIATRSVFFKLYPLFKERFQHPATMAGMLEIGSAYLPINNNWNRYMKEADLAYEDLNTESKYHLNKRAAECCRLMKDNAYKKDLWMWDQDWSVQELKMKKGVMQYWGAEGLNIKKGVKKSVEVAIKDKSMGNIDISKLTTEEHQEYISLHSKFKDLIQLIKQQIPVRRPLLPGYPAWYRKLCSKPNSENWSPGPQNIGTGMQIVPKLLHLCWEGYPLHYIRGKGWGFLLPYKSKRDDNDETGLIPLEELVKKCPVIESTDSASYNESEEAFGYLWKDVELNNSKKDFYRKKPKVKDHHSRYNGTGVWCNLNLENCCWFFKLPHKDGVTNRVGNPLAKDFISKFSENVLSGDGAIAQRIIEIAKMLSYWRNNRDRIKGQMAVWLDDEKSLSPALKGSGKHFGAILPLVVVCGTLTRRAMEPTWMTASNAYRERVGSELRSMIQSPPGYKIVGADVDSQELWIASVLGDASATGIHGATPLGWMTLSGSKSTSTDMHSITANAVGISRDHAKVINYARIYGAGQNFAERLLKQFNPTISDTDARSKAMKMFALTKGKKFYYLNNEFIDNLEARAYSSYEAVKLAKIYGKTISEMFKTPKWIGGTESAMFNRLEEIAGCKAPVTPFLNCRLSRALESHGEVDNRFLPTRINWVVQSGAVDFLHLMLVCMRWLMKDKVRFCLSFHDEVRYLVKDEDAYQAALAMHVTNLLTRSYCVSKIGLVDLPQSIAFFTSVEIDNVLRKESQNDGKTPSNPHGLSGGYEIKEGESLDIYKTIEKAGNDLSEWKWHKSD